MNEEIKNRIEALRSQGIRSDSWAVGYARVSSTKQERDASREDQVADIAEYAQGAGLHLVHTFSATESAYKTGRDCFNRMLRLAEEHGVQNVILKDDSRLTRNLGDQETVSDLLQNRIIRIHYYLTKQIIDDETDPFIGEIQAVVNKRYSYQISLRARRAHRNRASRGIPKALPLGYKFSAENKSIIEKDASAPAIEKIFSMYLKGSTTREIAGTLNALGYRSKKDCTFHHSRVAAILENKTYTGKYFQDFGEWRRVKTEMPAYISEADFEKVQQLKAKANTGDKQRRQEPYLLNGLIKCAQCGMYASGNRPDSVYYTHKCDTGKKPYYREDALFKVIDAEVVRFAYSEKYTDFLKERLKKILKAKDNYTQKETRELNRRIEVLRNRKSALLDDRLDRVVSEEDYRAKAREIDDNLDILQEKLKALSVDLGKYQNDAIATIDAIRRFTELYTDPYTERAEKAALLKQMVQHILFDGEKAVIVWRRPFDTLLNAETPHPSVLAESPHGWLTGLEPAATGATILGSTT